MSKLVDSVLDFEERWERPITIVLGVFFAISCAVYARFITLPDIPRIDEQIIFFWGSAGFNAIWHGFARPVMLKRKSERVKLAQREDR